MLSIGRARISSRMALGLLTGLLVGLAVGIMGLTLAVSDRLAPGVRAASVPIGGADRAAALARLRDRAEALEGLPIEVSADGESWHPSLRELGVRVDPETLVTRGYEVGRVGTLGERFDALLAAARDGVDVGGPTLERAALEGWVGRLAERFDREAVDASIVLDASGALRVAPEREGRRLDRSAAVAALGDAIRRWQGMLDSAPGAVLAPVVLRHEPLPATLTAATVATAREEGERILSRPVALGVEGERWPLERTDVARLLKLRRTGDRIKVELDEPRLIELVQRAVELFEREPIDARLTITADGAVRSAPDRPGRRVDRATTAAELRSALLAPDRAPVELRIAEEPVQAKVRSADLAVARTAAERVLAGPLQLSAADRIVELPPQESAALLRIDVAADSRTRVLAVDAAKLRPRIEALAAEVAREPRHARLRVVGAPAPTTAGAVATLPGGGAGAGIEANEEGVPGRRLEVEATLARAAEAIAAGERRVVLTPAAIPAITSADRAAFGALDLIESATTSYAGGVPERSHNIELAAARLDGTVVVPGATFSFNQALGSTSLESGFKIGWGIAIGDTVGAPPKTVPSVAGGICQVSTTLFQALFWAGYQIEERNYHLYWIPRYGQPPKGLQGLDATVDEEFAVDLKWSNTTNAPVLIQARTDGQRISFGLYGRRPDWSVEVAPPEIDQIVKTNGETVRQEDATLPPGRTLQIEEARDGFRSTIVRTVRTPGAPEPRVLRLTSTYQPSRNVILVAPGTRSPAPADRGTPPPPG